MKEPAADKRKRRPSDNDDPSRVKYEERGALYYPDLDAEPRTDDEWESYKTTVERYDARGEPQTFVVESTPFTDLGYNMVIIVLNAESHTKSNI